MVLFGAGSFSPAFSPAFSSIFFFKNVSGPLNQTDRGHIIVGPTCDYEIRTKI